MNDVEKQLRVSFEKISPKEGDVVVMRFPHGSTSEERAYLAEMLAQMNDRGVFPGDVAILILPEGYNLELLSDEQMQEFGWMRKLSS